MDNIAWEEEGDIVMEKFNMKMLRSGYSEFERGLFVKEGLARYQNIVKKVERGERPLYRMASWKKYNRALEKKVKARTWFGNVETVLFVQPTPGEVLRKKLQDLANLTEFKIKVVERGGRTVKGMLQRSDVIPNKKCWDDRCPVCNTEERGLCNMENIGYSILCRTCWDDPEKQDEGMKKKKFIMHGETSRTARVRCSEHRDALERRNNSNLWEHCVLEHGSEVADFDYKVERKFHVDSLLRLIDEAKRLEEEPGNILNDKLEFRQPFGVQIKASRMRIE